jgi:N4-gp56 family major capsid protein
MLYSDISPRTQAYADRRLLTRAKTNNIMGQFGQSRTLPMKATQTIRFRRYNRLAAATTPLAEGVTPSGKTLSKTDVTVPVLQYGDFIGITDVIRDTHEDPILQESTDILGEQAADTWDILRVGVLKAGTNVLYANGAARASVNTVFDIASIRTAIRLLKRQEAKAIRERQSAGPNIGTNPVSAAFVCVCHADAQPDIQALTGFIHRYQYANPDDAFEGEIGSVPDVRFVIDNNLTPWADAGDAKGSTLSTTGVSSDVYPLLIFGKDAYATVALGGKNAVSTYVNNPKSITGDELAQRGSVGWKGWTATAILNDAWMIRIESALNG